MNPLLRQFMLGVVCLVALSAAGRAEVRIKDITNVEGQRGNPISGLGLVIGLNGTGGRTLSTQQMAIDMQRKFEMSTLLARQSQLDNVFKTNNISAVMVTAELPGFARKGSKLDVVVSVFDDAASLEGGTLLMTPLRGSDGEVYAVAQGQLTIGGFRVRSNVQGGQQNHPTVARAQNAGTVEKEALSKVDFGGVIRLSLRDADYSTAKTIMLAINRHFPAVAKTIDAGTVQVRVPLERRVDTPSFISEIGQISVMPDTPARIVINERTGTVIVGHHVRISSVMIAHGNLSIKPSTTLVPTANSSTSPPNDQFGPPPGENEDPVEEVLRRLRPRELPNAAPLDKPLTLHEVEQTYTVADLARVLNALGVSPRDLSAIFQTLKDSGALHADLFFN